MSGFIKKKKKGDNDEFETGELVDENSYFNNIKDIECNARHELEIYLEKKGVNPKLAQDFKIVVENKNKSGNTSLSFTGPKDEIYHDMKDIFVSITESSINNILIKFLSGEEESLKVSKTEYKRLQKDLPAFIGGIKVFNFGSILSPEFSNKFKLYPSGYYCEQTVLLKDGKELDITCEITEEDEKPQFKIRLINPKKTFTSSTEEAVWGKLDSEYSLMKIYSFFNLPIELLLEGLDNVDQCQDYIIHKDRGFGELYTTEAEADLLFSNLVAQKSREFRSKHRERLLTAKETKLLRDYNEKLQQVEKDKKKKKLLVERELKKVHREEEKLQKQKSKEESKRNKEILKRENKNKEKSRKDVTKELFAARSHAINRVHDIFEIEQLEEKLKESLANSTNTLALDCDGILSCEIVLQTLTRASSALNLSPVYTEKFFDIASCLNTFKGLLELPVDFEMSNFIYSIVNVDATFDFKAIIPDKELAHTSAVQQSSEVPRDVICRDSCEMKSDCMINDKEPTSSIELVNKKITVETDSEAEWDDSNKITKSTVAKTGTVWNKSNSTSTEAMHDLVHLNIVRIVLRSLEDTLGVLDKDESKGSSKQSMYSLPLNQLTWVELARMIILRTLCSELAKVDDELLHLIRGAKSMHFKSAKNIVRFIRYRMLSRAKANALNDYSSFSRMKTGEDQNHKTKLDNEDHLHMMSKSPFTTIIARSSSYISPTEDSLQIDYSSESSIIDAVIMISSSDSYSEAYKRCAKIWVKLASIPQAKFLMWEIDKYAFPDYYEEIISPIVLSNVATSLIRKLYGTDDEVSPRIDIRENLVVSAFYRDMRQIFVNCFAYYSESSSIVSGAQRWLHCLHRHMQRWIFDNDIPEIECCDEVHCFLTPSNYCNKGDHTAVKCGRCLAIFSLQSINSVKDQIGVVIPNTEQISQQYEDWICCFCVREDSLIAEELSKSSHEDLFYYDEWGPSSMIPWILNSQHSALFSDKCRTTSSIKNLFDALKVLSSPHKSCYRDTSHQPSSKSVFWSVQDHLDVYRGLCEVLSSSQEAYAYLDSMSEESLRLYSMCESDNFREGEFIEHAKAIAGERGISLCRHVLDGVKKNDSDVNKLICEGRCYLCKGSTFEEDCEDDNVLLCDGCNVEAHLSCLELEMIPKKEWYCEYCLKRLHDRTSVNDVYINVDKHRRTKEEEILIDNLISSETLDDSGQEMLCMYCGKSESALCSPFVYGQSRDEFNFFEKSVSDCYATLPDTNSLVDKINVKFMWLNELQQLNQSSIPLFPLLSECDDCDIFTDTGCPVVHEICALHIFKARKLRNKSTSSKQLRQLIDKLVSFSGLAIKPLGCDHQGHIYWNFPLFGSIFVAPLSNDDFMNISNSNVDEDKGDWFVVTNNNELERIIQCLSDSGKEKDLKQNLLSYYFNCINSDLGGYSNVQNADESSKVEELHVANTKPKSVRNTEGKPVSLQLLKNKGCDIHSFYSIKYERIFEDCGLLDEDTEDDETYQRHFVFSKGTRYYAIGILDIFDKVVKNINPSKNTVVFQIHKAGIPTALTYVELSEPWSDGLYYFSPISFKKSGSYTLSFMIEGQYSSIKPLVFNVLVVSDSICCGVACGLDRLQARKYMNSSDRIMFNRRRELLNFTNNCSNELEALRSAILCLYLALPEGSLSINDDEVDMAESNSWNSVLDNYWRQSILQTSTPLGLMECLLVLEFYISKSWYAPNSKLVNSLPSPHFAIRCATLSSVGLRLFSIDRSLIYDKVQKRPRESRHTDTASVVKSEYSANRTSRTSLAAKRGEPRIDIEVDSDGESERSSIYFHARPRRASMDRARKQLYDSLYGSDDENGGGNRAKRKVTEYVVVTGAQTWVCPSCELENAPRARSCEACGERKPSGTVRNNNGPIHSTRKRKKQSDDESSMDDSVSASSDGPDADDIASSDSEPRRQSKKKHVSDSEVEDVFEEEEETQSFDFPKMIEEHSANDDGVAIKMLKILQVLYNDYESGAFWSPVNIQIYTDYLDKISEPIDLGTIAKRVDVGFYGNDVNEFARSVRLVWANCQAYNLEGSPIYDVSIRFSKEFEKLFEHSFQLPINH